MVVLILFDTFVKCSLNVNLLSNVNPKCFCDDAWETLLLLKRNRGWTKIVHASSEYRKVKYIRDNVLFWHIFMDVLFHRLFKHFWKIFDLVYCQVLFKYISLVFNRFLSWPTILCKIFWEKLKNQANLGADIVFAGRREMKIFSMVFRDFGKNMVGKRYFQH